MKPSYFGGTSMTIANNNQSIFHIDPHKLYNVTQGYRTVNPGLSNTLAQPYRPQSTRKSIIFNNNIINPQFAPNNLYKTPEKRVVNPSQQYRPMQLIQQESTVKKPDPKFQEYERLLIEHKQLQSNYAKVKEENEKLREEIDRTTKLFNLLKVKQQGSCIGNNNNQSFYLDQMQKSNNLYEKQVKLMKKIQEQLSQYVKQKNQLLQNLREKNEQIKNAIVQQSKLREQIDKCKISLVQYEKRICLLNYKIEQLCQQNDKWIWSNKDLQKQIQNLKLQLMQTRKDCSIIIGKQQKYKQAYQHMRTGIVQVIRRLGGQSSVLNEKIGIQCNICQITKCIKQNTDKQIASLNDILKSVFSIEREKHREQQQEGRQGANKQLMDSNQQVQQLKQSGVSIEFKNALLGLERKIQEMESNFA